MHAIQTRDTVKDFRSKFNEKIKELTELHYMRSIQTTLDNGKVIEAKQPLNDELRCVCSPIFALLQPLFSVAYTAHPTGKSSLRTIAFFTIPKRLQTARPSGRTRLLWDT